MTVADTGVGMDEAALARAFEPFFSTKTGGSGLGLANARRSVELQGGTIALASAPGVGTTVTISVAGGGCLPMRPQTREAHLDECRQQVRVREDDQRDARLGRNERDEHPRSRRR